MQITEIDKGVRDQILAVVDRSCLPSRIRSVWRRVGGYARDDSDWDVVVFTEDAPAELFKSNWHEIVPGVGKLEIIFARPEHLNDESRYMSEFRSGLGFKIR